MTIPTFYSPVRILASLIAAGLISACGGRPPVVARQISELPAQPGPDVTWYGPAGAPERVSLDNWRRSVGPPVIVAPRTGGTPAVADRILVVNWNMHVGGGDLARLLTDVRSRHGADAPVVMLIQEAYRSGPEVPGKLDGKAGFASLIRSLRADGTREEIEEVASRLGLHGYYVPSMRNGGPAASDEDRGNAILATVPLSELSAIELPFERQRRVAVAATISGHTYTGSAWRLRLVSAHLDNMVGARRLWIAGGEFGRTRQARGLVSALEGDQPLVLGADMNTWFGFRDAAYRTAARAFPQTRVSDRRATFHGLMRLDHLFFRLQDDWRADFGRADDTYGSDHHPLIGQITFNRQGNASSVEPAR